MYKFQREKSIVYKPPLINGLNPLTVKIPWENSSIQEYLQTRYPRSPDPELLLDSQGRELSMSSPPPPDGSIYVYLPLLQEKSVPGNLDILYEDERLLVIDKPHFLATMPRGSHLKETAVTKLRLNGYEEIAPLHRLDRLTAGVLALVKLPKYRGIYQTLFQDRKVKKTYKALAPTSSLTLPFRIESHLVKEPGILQAQELSDMPPNAATIITEETHLTKGLSSYSVEPLTGKFHQIRAHFNSLGLPLVNDPLYPVTEENQHKSLGTKKREENFTKPLGLLAHTLAFTDPVTGKDQLFTSKRNLN